MSPSETVIVVQGQPMTWSGVKDPEAEAGTRPPDEDPLTVVAALPKGLRVLLVEDRDDSRRLIERMLALMGCKVTAAADALDALSLYEPGAFDIVLSDVVMPAMTGFDLVECLKAKEPLLPYLYMSGYPAVGAATELLGIARPLICKPFSGQGLQRALAAVHSESGCDDVFGAWE